jgi:hypothetical protein
MQETAGRKGAQCSRSLQASGVAERYCLSGAGADIPLASTAPVLPRDNGNRGCCLRRAGRASWWQGQAERVLDLRKGLLDVNSFKLRGWRRR